MRRPSPGDRSEPSRTIRTVILVPGRGPSHRHGEAASSRREEEKALARGSIRAESNNSDGHSGSRARVLSKAGLDRFSLRTTLALINAAAAEDTKLPIPTMSHT